MSNPARTLVALIAIAALALLAVPGFAAAEMTAAQRKEYVESGEYIAQIEAALVPAREWIVERAKTTARMTSRCMLAGYPVGSPDPGPDPEADYSEPPDVPEPTPAGTRLSAPTKARCAKVEKLALGLDIDETALSNFRVGTAHPEYTTIQQGINEITGRGVALQPVFELYELARRYDVSVFFITAREEWMRGVTTANLASAGYSEVAGLYMKPTLSLTADKGEVKAAQRAELELRRGYAMIEMVGDQASDTADGWEELGVKIPSLD
ncbi:MAG: HAD family acid phosphatase [Solirubrobacterales bacterium]